MHQPFFRLHRSLLVATLVLLLSAAATAQQITGVWHGRIDGRKVELKLVQRGDSLTGTAYYFDAPQRYRQYRVKGYFDAVDNSVVWWDDVLLQQKGPTLFSNGAPLLSVADFNCPGGGRMFLDGKAAKKDEPDNPRGRVDLAKGEAPLFPDAWDYVIANYTVGTADPRVIDSIALIAFTPPARAPQAEVPEPQTPEPAVVIKENAKPQPAPPIAVLQPPTIEEKFNARKKIIATEIPVAGDSIELRFYDNAEVDGDSISLFLNGLLLFQHIRLTEKAYTIQLPATAFGDSAELVMVAENLGSIPPNSSYMVAVSGGRRYEARLASTEWSSAAIRLRKEARTGK